MRNRKRLLIATGATVVIAAAAAFAGWYFILRSDAPPPVDLESAVEAATVTAPTGTGTGAGVTGTWAVDAGSGSFVGYRVKEELATIGFTEAVGRTTNLEATLAIDGTVITVMSVEADMTALQSDSSRRDRALRSQAIETDDFPTSAFELTSPIELGDVPVDGATLAATASGHLTIHGVTLPVEVPIEAQLTGDTIVVVASIPVVFADYDIASPSSLNLLSVEDNGVIEMQLLFTRA